MVKNTEDPELEESETDEEDEDEEEETVESLTAKLAAAKKESRKWEGRSKKNYEELQKSKVTDQTKPDAVKAAELKGREDALAEIAEERVHDAIETALEGRGLDDDAIQDILDSLNVARFLTSEHRVDRERVSSFVDRVAPSKRKPAKKKDDEEEDEETPPGIPRRPRTAAVPAAAAGTRKPTPAVDRGKTAFATRYPNGLGGKRNVPELPALHNSN